MGLRNESLEALRKALNVSPDNQPLRKIFARKLFDDGQFSEAETEFKALLAATPRDIDARLGLASTYFRQGRNSAAEVVVESLGDENDARIFLLRARLLQRAGDHEGAVSAYQAALRIDSTSRDPLLAEELGLATSATLSRKVRAVRLEIDEDPPFDEDTDVELEVEDSETIEATLIDIPPLDFEDVGGLEQIKDEIRMRLVLPMVHPELFLAYKRPLGGGLLLYGPPGCGKTHIARAAAGEAGARFISVEVRDILSIWLGRSEENLHGAFEQARENAPCVLFFDEVDALAGHRTLLRRSPARRVVSTLLCELDALRAHNPGVLVLAATSTPWQLDPAFIRAGRLDRHIFVAPPDDDARGEILKMTLRTLPCDSIDLERVARATTGYTGADLRALVERVSDQRLRQSLRQGRPLPITTDALLAASSRPSVALRDWFAQVERAAGANELPAGLEEAIHRYLG